MRAVALLLLLSLPARGQDAPRLVLQVQDGYVRTLTGDTVQVKGGAYLDGPSLIASGREMAELRAQNAALKEAPVAPPSSLVVALFAGLAIGLAGGFVIAWVAK